MAENRRSERGSDRRRGLVGAVDRLNRALFPWLGPPPLGPYGDPVAPSEPARCPLCGGPMSEHTIDRSGPRTMLACPR